MNRTHFGRNTARCLRALLALCAAALAWPAHAQQSLDQLRYRGAVSLTTGISNTQYPFYADNAINVDAGFYYRAGTVGLQMRAGVYQYSARFSQVPVTGGLYFSRAARLGDRTLLQRAMPFTTAGVGLSRQQDAGPNNTPLPAKWDICWQGSAGLDIQYYRFSWRAAEVFWLATQTQDRGLRTVGIRTGLVYQLR